MSTRDLYRVMVRMLYDESFARAIYEDTRAALAGEEITAVEASWLVAPDPRAYRTDPWRRSRSLGVLMEEFPTAAAFVLRRGREGPRRPETELLDAFFSSGNFHRSVRDGESMVFAFAEYLAAEVHGGIRADARVAPLVRLETAIARVRRAGARSLVATSRAVADPSSALQLAPWAKILELPSGTTQLHDRISRALVARGRTALQSLLDARWSLPVLLDLAPDASEHVLVEPSALDDGDAMDKQVVYATITAELFHLLAAAEEPVPREGLAARARELGAEAGTEAEIVRSLVGDGLLAEVGARPPTR